MSDGFFDELLGRPTAKRRASTQAELDVASLVSGALAAIDQGAAAPARARVRLCSRCLREEAKARAAGDAIVIPPREAESWLLQGRRYYAATCRACTDLEWSELWQVKYNRADEKKNAGDMKRLVDLAHARQAAGRRIHVALPSAAERHASYEAR